MAEELEQSDRARGVAINRLAGAEGAVDSAVRDILTGPDQGTADFVIETDASGKVVSVTTTGKGAEWQNSAKRIQAALAGKTAQFRGGSGAVRVVIHTEVAYLLPDGRTAPISKPEFSGIGVAVHFDLSDIGQKPTRQVHTRTVSETRL